jgi:hypothetical protein
MAFYCGFSNLFATTDLKDFEAAGQIKEDRRARRPFSPAFLSPFSRGFISCQPNTDSKKGAHPIS